MDEQYVVPKTPFAKPLDAVGKRLGLKVKAGVKRQNLLGRNQTPRHELNIAACAFVLGAVGLIWVWVVFGRRHFPLP